MVWVCLVLLRSPLPERYFAERDARRRDPLGSQRYTQNLEAEPLLVIAERPFMYLDRPEPALVTGAYVASLPAETLASLITAVADVHLGFAIGYRRSSWIRAAVFAVLVFGQWYMLARIALGLWDLIDPVNDRSVLERAAEQPDAADERR